MSAPHIFNPKVGDMSDIVASTSFSPAPLGARIWGGQVSSSVSHGYQSPLAETHSNGGKK